MGSSGFSSRARTIEARSYVLPYGVCTGSQKRLPDSGHLSPLGKLLYVALMAIANSNIVSQSSVSMALVELLCCATSSSKVAEKETRVQTTL